MDTAASPTPDLDAMLAELATLGMRGARVVTRMLEIEQAAAEAAATWLPEPGSTPASLSEAAAAGQGVDAVASAMAQAVPRTEILARALDRLSRSVRRTVALRKRMQSGWPRAAADDRAAMLRRQVARAIADRIRQQADGEAAERLFDELAERLDDPILAEEIQTLPVEQVGAAALPRPRPRSRRPLAARPQGKNRSLVPLPSFDAESQGEPASPPSWHVMPGLDPRLSGSLKLIKSNALPSCPDLIRASTASQCHRPNPLKAGRRHEPIDATSDTPWMPVKHTAVRFDENHKEQCLTVMPGLDPGIHGVPASPAQPVKSQSSPRTDRRHQQTPWMPVSSTGMTIRFTSLPTITRTGQPCVKHGHDVKSYCLTNDNAKRTAMNLIRAEQPKGSAGKARGMAAEGSTAFYAAGRGR